MMVVVQESDGRLVRLKGASDEAIERALEPVNKLIKRLAVRGVGDFEDLQEKLRVNGFIWVEFNPSFALGIISRDSAPGTILASELTIRKAIKSDLNPEFKGEIPDSWIIEIRGDTKVWCEVRNEQRRRELAKPTQADVPEED